MSEVMIDGGTVFLDEQGYEWPFSEWVEHAAEHGITWHIRLDGRAIVEGKPWEGGAVLLEPKE